MGLRSSLSSMIAAWATCYAGHPMVALTVRWLHLAGLLGGGGAALVADRRVLRAAAPDRPAALAVVAGSHAAVLTGLAVAAGTGLLMIASDLQTYVASRVFWTKMVLVLLLVANGAVLRRAARAAAPGGQGWPAVRVASALSALLWLVILFVGLWLTEAA